jgi:hypothetical protein
MPRDMSAAMLAAVAASDLRPAIFVTAAFTSGTVYMWTGFGSVTWGGHTWLGVGSFGSISTIEDGATVEARGVTLTLSGIDQALLTGVLDEFILGAPATIYLGLFNSSNALIADPVVAWAGKMDQPTIDVGADSAIISINCENRLVDMNISVQRRYTNEDAQLDYPGDKGFEFVNTLQQKAVFWGHTPNSLNNV